MEEVYWILPFFMGFCTASIIAVIIELFINLFIRKDTNVKILESNESPEEQYENYLSNHILNVQSVWEEVLRPKLENELDEDTIELIDILIEEHDESKYDEEEWEAYMDNFYPNKDNPKPKDEVSLAFKYAWNRHQKQNLHHPEYWVLQKDDSLEFEALDIPIEHVIPLLCDWGSFRYGNRGKPIKEGDFKSTRDWYEAQREKQIMTDNTRKLIEKYIDLLP